MLQNYSTVNNHTWVSEKKYKLMFNPTIRSTLKIKKNILHERGGTRIVPPC